MSEALEQWVQAQRAMARALGVSLEDWMAALDAAARHRAGLTAAVIGASMARKLGMPNLSRVDGSRLAATARQLIDPAPPRARHPVLAEAIRRAQNHPADDEDPVAEGPQAGAGAQRLARSETRPDRAAPSTAPSAAVPTADAPGCES